MFYERTETGWEANNKKSFLFNGSTYPIESIPSGFWNADRMKAAPMPVYDPATHKMVGPQEVSAWLVGYIVETLTPAEIEAAYKATIPNVVTMRQARIYLDSVLLLDGVTAQIQSLGGESLITWEYSQEVQRSNPLVATMATALGWTETDLDTMFLEASKL